MARDCRELRPHELLRMDNRVLRRKVDYLQHAATLKQFDTELDLLRDMRMPSKWRS